MDTGLLPLGKKGKFSREQKQKARVTRPRKSNLWAPTPIIVNETMGVLTRARTTLAREYSQQQKNDVVIQEVIGDLSDGVGDDNIDITAPESQHTPGSMDTLNINLEDSVFQGGRMATAETYCAGARF